MNFFIYISLLMLSTSLCSAKDAPDEDYNLALDSFINKSVLEGAQLTIKDRDLNPERITVVYSDKSIEEDKTCDRYKKIISTKIILTHLYRDIFYDLISNSHMEFNNKSSAIYNEIDDKLRTRYKATDKLDAIASYYFGHYTKFSLIKNGKYDAHSLIRELLSYHDKIIATNNWEQLFDNINNKYNINSLIFKQGKLYHDAGFPKPSNTCTMNAAWSPMPFIYTEDDVTLEAWLYSFWHRRHNEGNFNLVFSYLTRASKYN